MAREIWITKRYAFKLLEEIPHLYEPRQVWNDIFRNSRLQKIWDILNVSSLSCVWLFVTPWTVAYEGPPSMGSSRQEYWSGLPFPSPRDLPDPGMEPQSPALQADALSSEPPGKPFVNWPVYISKFLKCQSKFWAQRINHESCDVINYY